MSRGPSESVGGRRYRWWQRIVALAVLLLSVPWLLHHAIRFWTLYTAGGWPGWGSALWLETWHGWAPPVAAELVALWGWSQAGARGGWPNGWTIAGLAASLVLVAGPVYVVTDPVLRELAAPPVQTAETPQIEALRAEIATLEADARTYRESRATGSLADTQAALRSARAALLERLDVLRANGRERAAALDWRRAVILGLQLALILLLQTMAAVAYRVAFGVARQTGAPVVTAQRPASAVTLYEPAGDGWRPSAPVAQAETAETAETTPIPANGRPPAEMAGAALAERLREEVRRRWPAHTWIERADALGVSKKAMSYVKNYERKSAEGVDGLDGYMTAVRDALWPPETRT